MTLFVVHSSHGGSVTVYNICVTTIQFSVFFCTQFWEDHIFHQVTLLFVSVPYNKVCNVLKFENEEN